MSFSLDVLIRVDVVEDTARALRLFLRVDFSQFSWGSLGFLWRVFVNLFARALYFVIDEFGRVLVIAELLL